MQYVSKNICVLQYDYKIISSEMLTWWLTDVEMKFQTRPKPTPPKLAPGITRPFKNRRGRLWAPGGFLWDIDATKIFNLRIKISAQNITEVLVKEKRNISSQFQNSWKWYSLDKYWAYTVFLIVVGSFIQRIWRVVALKMFMKCPRFYRWYHGILQWPMRLYQVGINICPGRVYYSRTHIFIDTRLNLDTCNT